jgi:hypothetical protein
MFIPYCNVNFLVFAGVLRMYLFNGINTPRMSSSSMCSKYDVFFVNKLKVPMYPEMAPKMTFSQLITIYMNRFQSQLAALLF